MGFNAEEHRERIRIISHGRAKWPEEKNITKLYEMACKELGIEVKKFSTATVNHLPTPEESARENPRFAQICPKCGERAYYVRDLCRGCKEAEGGKYKTKLECFKCHYTERSEEPSVVWLERWKIDFGMQTKASLGIKTMTDEGLK